MVQRVYFIYFLFNNFSGFDVSLVCLQAQLKIKGLQDKYQRQLGSRFSLKSFHDAILTGCYMPLNVLETYLVGWALAQR